MLIGVPQLEGFVGQSLFSSLRYGLKNPSTIILNLDPSTTDSSCVPILSSFFIKEESQSLLFQLALTDKTLKSESDKVNFWTRNNFVIEQVHCERIDLSKGIQLKINCKIKGKDEIRSVFLPFPQDFTDKEGELKDYLISTFSLLEFYREAGQIANLPFGKNYNLPTNLLWNNVPHANWVRNFLYRYASDAVIDAIKNPKIQTKSKLRITVNVPEMNPEFDTYRIGTMLELVREIVISLLERDAYKIKICVQQSLGEGIRSGLPISLGSMRAFLERMDWGSIPQQYKFQPQDNIKPRSEALIRLGQIGKDQVFPDDDIFIIIAPQNSVGGMITQLLKEMIEATNGKPVILINPNLKDRPSSDNLMSTAGRGERIDFANSFQDIFAIKLIYPGNAGMFPI
eukprot:gene2061-2194_t